MPPRPDLSRVRARLVEFIPVIAVVLVARVVLAEAVRITSGSMEPTLQVGDWLFVNKLRYGPHLPFTRLALPGYSAPERNDVIVFVSPPQDPAVRMAPDEVTPTLVKRLVAVAGDTILMRQGRLLVNGAVVPPRNTGFVVSDRIGERPSPLFAWQHGIEVTGSRFGPPIRSPSLHEWGPLLVPAGTLFVLGDNRDNSVDSRYYGPVPRANVRGRPMFVYYSYNTESGLDFLRAIFEIRWHRLGTWIR